MQTNDSVINGQQQWHEQHRLLVLDQECNEFVLIDGLYRLKQMCLDEVIFHLQIECGEDQYHDDL